MIAPAALVCPCSATLAPLVLASGIPATCPTCGAEYLPPRPSASPAPARAPERPRSASTPEARPERPQRPASAPRDLDALARVLPVLTGSASPLVRIPGGQSEGSPAERVQGLLGPALRAASRLAWIRQAHPRECLALLATYVHAGPELRASSDWPESLELALRPRTERVAALASAARAGAGPRTHGAKSEGIALLARAEALYAEAEEQPSDGRWLTDDLDTVGALLAELREDQRWAAHERLRRSRVAEPGIAHRILGAARCLAPQRTICAPARTPSLCRTGRGTRYVEGTPLARRALGRCG